MDPIVASTAAHVIRTAVQGPAAGELSAVLRDGRIVAGEVLRSPGDGSLLVALGRHQVPAQTDLRLDPGQTFLARVRQEGGAFVLQLLGHGAPEGEGLLQALRGVLGDSRPLGELLQGLAAALRSRLAPGAGAPAAGRGALEALLAALDAFVLPPGADGPALARLLEASGLRHEALLLASRSASDGAVQRERLRGDLKARLLLALQEAEEGPAREAVARALAGLEAEQLLNLARRRAGEPWVWSLAVPDGSGPGWTTARLLVHERDEERAPGGGAAPPRRLTLGVRFAHVGPVRADLVLAGGALAVRLTVADGAVGERLARDAAELGRRLGGGRDVHVLHRVVPPEEVLAGVEPLDIRYLREHHLMDVSG